MSNTVFDDARLITRHISAWRRYLHANPELSGQERMTAGFLAGELRKIDLKPEENIGDTWGLSATLRIDDRPAVALRADMDALPVSEQTGLEFASTKNGVMHACGHDAHMAMLLGAAVLLRQRARELKRSVKLIFQPHEELYPGGASAMIAGGVLADVESILGLHIWSQLPTGTIGTRIGPFMSSVNDIEMEIEGKGGHAAMPHECIDPIVVAAQIINALQTAVSRSISMTDNAIVSITTMKAGSAYNIIPPTAHLSGTIRTLNEAVRARVCTRVCEIAEGIAGANRATARVEIKPGYPVTVNDENVVKRVRVAARKLGVSEEGLLDLDAQGGGEDFAYYGQQIPAALVFLGGGSVQEGGSYPHHHPRFDINEAALPLGAALLAQYALQTE
ncbi:MAG: amidohydrolase [Planctomycetota bacterium]